MSSSTALATANFKSKEKSLFTQMLNFYDNKQFKQSLRNADQILEKHPDHPETLAMKALNMNSLKRKIEAFEFIKKALFKNLSNFTCWHVYGILHRSNKNPDEARKAYLNALKYDKDNQNVLRDLGQLQIQLRDYEGYAETRRQILVSKPTVNINWMAYACHKCERALEVLESFDKTLKENKEKLKNHERTEITLFKAKLFEEMGDYQKAINLLQKKGLIVDQISKFRKLAENYQKLGNKDKALEHLEDLLELSSANTNNYYQILAVHGYSNKEFKYSSEDQLKIKEIIEVYENRFPRGNSHQRVLLKILTGELFREKLYQYSKPYLIKGVPPLIVDLKDVYQDKEKTQILEETLLSHLKSMEEKNTLFNDEQEQDPTVYLWLLYYTAQHYYYLRDYNQALKYINEAINHTPTVIDLYVVKAKIYKRAGDREYASKLYEEARKLDLADRYLNAVSSRYLIRADHVEEAEETMGQFSKEGQELNVHDMQCMWYENEVGLSYLRQGNYRLALKNFNYIEKHMEQVFEDQLDFHLYAMRKYTLNAYFQMLEMEDNIYKNKNAVRAAIGIIKTMKKVDKIREEEQKKFQPEFDSYKASTEYIKMCEELKKRDEDDEFKNDFDPKGYDLYQKALQDPIKVAYDFAVLVASCNPEVKEVQAKMIPIYLRKNKLLEALKAVIALTERHPTYEKTLSSRIRFSQHWNSLTEEQRKQAIPDEKLLKVASQEFEALGASDEQSLKNLSEELLNQNLDKIEHVHEYIKTRTVLFKENDTAKYEKVAIDALTNDLRRNFKVHNAANTLKRLTKIGASDVQYRQKAQEVFIHARHFD
ncbi:n-alpha-acetyltransferase auxiliary subunit-like [Stylonychia lemnae]|uniref:N-alpha-acetyltransferase auxiliary subunit-like n=1 Tax=Stylonychia lemnae TaxID=5949 RepID=A0A078B6A5_STYLE|nr:n-alpha-acetyltransferase auxiliary subunit-like [Stylonychia lemnae]|eukprot:CDW89756.1 n-alpha-acetyltransferase auxiliary subunit-like [Stylonychia lemnae]